MASEQATDLGVPVLGAKLSAPPNILSNPTAAQPASEPIQIRSLKRSRADQSQIFTGLGPIAEAGVVAPSLKSPRFKGAFSPAISSIPLTGAAAVADERRRQADIRRNQDIVMSENPAYKALSSLMAGGGAGMSKPQDAQTSITSMSKGMSTAANNLSIPSPVMQFEDKSETSPTSATSITSMGTTARTATASSTVVASPASMTNAIEAENGRLGNGLYLQPPMEENPSNRALSFPGNVMGRIDPSRIAPRGMSLPMPGQTQQLAPRSPSQKKHKCPYCETEFTRHHNLKSHLLTHSQEKPYVCQTCSMRFRRLHDLKRHMKLHTGERPHICPKCDRKFARGDALARHSKGQGGCAGRRASMGSFGDGEEFEGSNAGDDDGAMDGIMYTNGAPHPNEAEMTEEDRRRFSLPSIKAQHIVGNQASGDNYNSRSRTPSTYPPAGPRPVQNSGGLYPPNTDRRGTSNSGTSTSMQSSVTRNHISNTSISSLPLNTGGSSMFSQSGMTESPKPLSPAGMQSHQLNNEQLMNRQRSPSLSTQFPQQHFSRRQSSISSPPPGMSLPSPHNASHAPKLPALSGLTPTVLAPPDQRFTLSSQTPTQQISGNNSHSKQAQQTSGAMPPAPMFQNTKETGSSRVTPTNHQASGSADNSTNLFASDEKDVWNLINELENKNKLLEDKVRIMESKEKIQEDNIKRLSEQLLALQNQLNTQTQNQQHQAIS